MEPERSRPAFDPFLIDCRGTLLDCRPGMSRGAQVMGVLNVTPDSFSDGGAYLSTDDALRRAEAILEEGGTLIDVGGESTRPKGRHYGQGALPVTEDEELSRVLPVIQAIRSRFPEAILSIDTYKSRVAGEALDAGVHMVNDVTGLRYDAGIAGVAARAGAPLVVMHSLGNPGEMPHAHTYENVLEDVRLFLYGAIKTAEQAGVSYIVTDPGFGFGKTPEENLKLIKGLPYFVSLGRPILVGISRKSTIGMILGSKEAPRAPLDRLYGSLGATAVAVWQGASIVRTHDVRPTVEMLRIIGAMSGLSLDRPIST